MGKIEKSYKNTLFPLVFPTISPFSPFEAGKNEDKKHNNNIHILINYNSNDESNRIQTETLQ